MKKQLHLLRTYTVGIIFIVLVTSCKKSQESSANQQAEQLSQNTVSTISEIWQTILQDTTPFKLECENIDGKSVTAYWLENPAVDYDAIRYYLGEFRPSDDETTAKLLEKIASAPESETPFYFHILTQLLKQADGAVAEILPMQTEKFIREHSYFFAHYLADKTHKGRKETTDLYAQFIQTALAQQKIDTNAWKNQLVSACKQCNEDEKQILENFCAMLAY